jgi:hypothetical protein
MRRGLALLALLLVSSGAVFAQSAGKVDRVMPAGFIARGKDTAEAKQADPVQWNDILRTNDAGRMRIALDDGSMLSVGAHSELRVVKHDVQSNQTLIEMLYGKARANVVPIRKNGGSFQVRTPTAVIGVLGTTVTIETVAVERGSAQLTGTVTQEDIQKLPVPRQNISDLLQLIPGTMPSKTAPDTPTIADYIPVNGTFVQANDHMVGVRNIDPEIPKTVFLLPGQYTYVGRGQPPTDPQFADPNKPQQYQPPSRTLTADDIRNTCPGAIDLRSFERLFPNGPRPSYEITGRGTSTGQVFDVHITNPTRCPLQIQIPAGAVLEPTGYTERLVKGILFGGGMPPLKDYQIMMSEGGFDGDDPFSDEYRTFLGIPLDFFVPAETHDIDFPLRGYCLELHKLAPHQKTKYKFVDPDEQQRLSAPNMKIMETADRLFFTGQANPPNASLDSLVQWSLWASREGLSDGKKFEEQYVGLVEKNYKAQDKKFDKKTKENVEQIARGFWPYVQKVLAASK